MFDVFFISFRESNAEENWQRLLELHPNAKRLHGVKGIDTVHLACNSLCSTEWFWTVDGDNYLLKELLYDVANAPDPLLMFQAIDPLSGQHTTLGGVKLWKKDSIINTNMSKGDFCLNATASKWCEQDVFSETRFNATPYETWKTSFRHCVKLLSSILENRYKADSKQRYLDNWDNCQNFNSKNSEWAYRGYLDAIEYVKQEMPLQLINDYDMLEKFFKEKHHG